MTKQEVRKAIKEELLEVLKEYSGILQRGIVICDRYGDYYRREVAPIEAVNCLIERLENRFENGAK